MDEDDSAVFRHLGEFRHPLYDPGAPLAVLELRLGVRVAHAANEPGAEPLHPRYRPGELLPVYLEVAIDGTGPIGQLGGEA